MEWVGDGGRENGDDTTVTGDGAVTCLWGHISCLSVITVLIIHSKVIVIALPIIRGPVYGYPILPGVSGVVHPPTPLPVRVSVYYPPMCLCVCVVDWTLMWYLTEVCGVVCQPWGYPWCMAVVCPVFVVVISLVSSLVSLDGWASLGHQRRQARLIISPKSNTIYYNLCGCHLTNHWPMWYSGLAAISCNCNNRRDRTR